MDLRDKRALQAVKNVYGGSIKLKSNIIDVWYRLHNREGLFLMFMGLIRNPSRLV